MKNNILIVESQSAPRQQWLDVVMAATRFRVDLRAGYLESFPCPSWGDRACAVPAVIVVGCRDGIIHCRSSSESRRAKFDTATTKRRPAQRLVISIVCERAPCFGPVQVARLWTLSTHIPYP